MDLDFLIPVSVLSSIGVTIYYMTKTLTNYYLRKRMIDRGLVGEDAGKLLSAEQTSSNKFASLKWGLIILFGGIGLAIIDPMIENNDNTTMPIGILGICVSVGFLIYYFIVKRANQDS